MVIDDAWSSDLLASAIGEGDDGARVVRRLSQRGHERPVHTVRHQLAHPATC